MAVDTQGLEIDTNIRALEVSDGFVISVTTDWFSHVPNHELTNEQQKAARQAQSEGLLGLQLEAHESSFADANTRIDTVVSNWVDDINTFITNFNQDDATTE